MAWLTPKITPLLICYRAQFSRSTSTSLGISKGTSKLGSVRTLPLVISAWYGTRLGSQRTENAGARFLWIKAWLTPWNIFKCHPNRLRGYAAVGGRKWPFPITHKLVAYTTTCTTIQPWCSAVLYFVTWPSWEALSASAHKISLKSDDSWPRYSDRTIFEMVAVRHLEFLKFSISAMWPVSECDSASSYQISR